MERSDITHRARTDADFVAAIRTNPSTAPAEYELSDETIAAIESGDESRIRAALGVEYRKGVPNLAPPDRV